jgi:hypothetical protein
MNHKLNRRTILKSSAAAVTAYAVAPCQARAQTAAYTPEDLKPGGALTPFGALKAGNADGSIPAWDGGYSTVPEGYKSGDLRPDPFADEKPVLTITSQNYQQYKDKLCDGVVALLTKYPDYRMDIYPTHRTAVAPQWVYDNIYQNAHTAQLSADGNSFSGAIGGIPFPIPQNGHEVMWNHLCSWQGVSLYFESDAHTITSSGEIVLESRVKGWFQYPYYFQGATPENTPFFFEEEGVPIAPPYEAGGSILLRQAVNPELTATQGYLYLLGERRVRKAPELEYDTPNSLTGGTTNWDEANVFGGKLDEYDFKLIGKKEMYVPYNSIRAWTAPADKQFMPHFFNPDYTRWELHRVWVVQATLKPGKRNVDASRIIYTDEDTGSALISEMYDASGGLWKIEHIMPAVCYDVPAVVTGNFFITYELHAGDYSVANHYSADTLPQWKVSPRQPESFYSGPNLAAISGGF